MEAGSLWLGEICMQIRALFSTGNYNIAPLENGKFSLQLNSESTSQNVLPIHTLGT